MTQPLLAATLATTVGLALLAVVARDLLVSILSLSGASLVLAVYFYLAGAPIAAVFEAVVAAGLVTVLFLLIVSLTETETAKRVRGSKLVVIGVALGGLLAVGITVWALLGSLSATGGSDIAFAEALWTGRPIDLLGVIVLVFVGVLAVVRLTAERLDTEAEAATDSREVDS